MVWAQDPRLDAVFTLSNASSGSRLRAGSRPVLRAGLLALLVALGFLAMHTMHGQEPVAGSDVVQGASVHADHAAGSTTAADTAGGGATGGLDCEGCPAAHLGLAVTCLVALLLVLFVLTPPRLLRVSFGQRLRAGPRPGLAHSVVPRPPSLQVLCISRT
ncbi:conserved hypothetical protein [Citricoccus sp. K5]|nr:conserved hypothetical protein [Citricoccus sp. K5]